MPRKPLAIPELRSTPEQRAAQLAWARRYYQQHIAPIDKLWGECERKVKERMMETKERPLAERVAELETIVQSILRREAEDIVAQHEQPAPAPLPTMGEILDREIHAGGWFSCDRCGKPVTNGMMCICTDTGVTPPSPLNVAQPAPAPSVADVLDRLREQVSAVLTCDDDVSLKTLKSVLFLVDAARREAGK